MCGIHIGILHDGLPCLCVLVLEVVESVELLSPFLASFLNLILVSCLVALEQFCELRKCYLGICKYRNSIEFESLELADVDIYELGILFEEPARSCREVRISRSYSDDEVCFLCNIISS